MADYQTIIHAAVRKVAENNQDITVARVKRFLPQPIPLGILMPAVHAAQLLIKNEGIAALKVEQPLSSSESKKETRQITHEELVSLVVELQQRVTALEAK